MVRHPSNALITAVSAHSREEIDEPRESWLVPLGQAHEEEMKHGASGREDEQPIIGAEDVGFVWRRAHEPFSPADVKGE
jgi:hypothetical protein